MSTSINLHLPERVFNDHFKNFILTEDSRFQILVGGAGSGKSHAAAQKIINYTLRTKFVKILVIRKVARTLRHSVFALITAIIHDWGLSKYFKINKSDLVITCVNGSQIIFSGVDDPEKIKSIHGIHYIWIEEATELNEDDFQQVNLRLRGVGQIKRQMILTFNPVSALHWIKRCFFDSPFRRDVFRDHSTYKDNIRWLGQDYIDQLENLINESENFYRIYALGEWGLLEGLVYKAWEVVSKPTRYDNISYGLDFGYSSNPAALVRVYDVGELERYVEEVVYETNLTNPMLIEKMREAGIDRHDLIIADSAEPKSIEEIRRAGFNIHACKKGADSIRNGIVTVQKYDVFIVEGSQNIINENSAYSWAKGSDGKPSEKPVKFKDHAMDAIRYNLSSRKPLMQVSKVGASGFGL